MTDFGKDTRVVHLIQAVCHPYNAKYNDWSLNIQFKDNATSTQVTGSLRCCMTADVVMGETIYTVVPSNLAVTQNRVLTVDFPPATSNLPVGCISQIIRGSKLHMFEYTREGPGCRHWM